MNIITSTKVKAIDCVYCSMNSVHAIKMENKFWAVVEKDVLSIPDHIKEAFK